MLESVEIWTESKHYDLPLDENNRCAFAAPVKVPTNALSFFCTGNKRYFMQDRYILEQRRGCKPVYAKLVTSMDIMTHAKLGKYIPPWVIYYNTVARRRQRFFQPWRDNID